MKHKRRYRRYRNKKKKAYILAALILCVVIAAVAVFAISRMAGKEQISKNQTEVKALVINAEKVDESKLKDLIESAGKINQSVYTDETVNTLNQAKELLQKIPQDDPTYTYSIKYLYYQIYKSEKKYEQALTYLEDYTNILDSTVYSNIQSKILNIEHKYNHLKISKEVDNLKMKQQNYIIVSVICIAALLLIVIGYLLYRKQAKEKILKQQKELDKMKLNLYTLSLELEKKRSLLNTFKEKDENYDQLQEDIVRLSANYRKLQNKLLIDSPLYKELTKLGNQNIPGNNKSLITEKRWKAITNEITTIYPELYNYIYSLGPNLPEEDFQYCCLYLFGFDTNTEAKLLNIAPNSVSKKRSRLKLKLNITFPTNSSLYEYLIKNMH